MLGIRLSTSPSGLAPVSLYSDILTAGGSFADRQWFTSGANSGASNSISYGGGEVRIFSGASGRHCICHFDCMMDQYPTFSPSKTYSIGDIVYGGSSGHGLYRKTALASGSPVFTTATNAQDANGWTRYRPIARNITEGKSLGISLKLKLNRAGYTITSANAIRIGLFGSVGSYINYDNHGLSNAVFNGYTGYMFGYGPANTKILRRTQTANPPLVSTTTNIYTELGSQSVSGFGGLDEYNVSITLKRIGSSLEITNYIYGSGYSSKFSYIDATPFTNFDTLAFYTVSNNVASMAIANPVASFIGGGAALPPCTDSVAKVLMTGWAFGNRLLSPIGYAPYGFETYQYGDEVVRYETGVWIYSNAQMGEIARAYSYESRPWIVQWPAGFTASKICP